MLTFLTMMDLTDQMKKTMTTVFPKKRDEKDDEFEENKEESNKNEESDIELESDEDMEEEPSVENAYEGGE